MITHSYGVRISLKVRSWIFSAHPTPHPLQIFSLLFSFIFRWIGKLTFFRNIKLRNYQKVFLKSFSKSVFFLDFLKILVMPGQSGTTTRYATIHDLTPRHRPRRLGLWGFWNGQPGLRPRTSRSVGKLMTPPPPSEN